ncbi:MAG: nucleotide exchange factor GrpE [Gammaproteobacteria bacterium]|nr:MAG: nucleotide exchange factor GrpE [Gammaproteobacteria bacterium]RTZ76676.1 MAG: nucleotide exchange factor GrpE [Gammaproteobacteria bacterium]
MNEEQDRVGEQAEDPQAEEEACLDNLSAEELARLLEEARAKADQHWDKVVRTQAEMDNLKKRHQRELEHAHKFGLEKFVAELLGVWDSLELGYHAAKENHDIEKLLEGTELTLKMLADAMSKFGVEQIDPQGEPFDPEKHQAMQVVERDDVPPNTVVEVIQKGYSLNGRLVRPALVMVSKSPA